MPREIFECPYHLDATTSIEQRFYSDFESAICLRMNWGRNTRVSLQCQSGRDSLRAARDNLSKRRVFCRERLSNLCSGTQGVPQIKDIVLRVGKLRMFLQGQGAEGRALAFISFLRARGTEACQVFNRSKLKVDQTAYCCTESGHSTWEQASLEEASASCNQLGGKSPQVKHLGSNTPFLYP
ncbi:hypothetical protein CEXT_713941 [Caerostris extrusa]|uniref:Uncharacterized protein n=1 Tax=Caerostris extrusa TaxID=172846 RepID=A0AAV4N306_CAEEX|nr:hypothetical protein CEXT_713941 [Caerostris extrusa]